ncbi:MAG: hypothetical protein QOF39_2482 [Frankiales bacterium]|jgi:hypothetical protein|nr:hypothetical protein [Frankiales bacterium]
MSTRGFCAVLGVVALAAGCGGSSAPKAGSPEAAVESAVRAYSAAIVSGNGAKGFQLVSDRCQQAVDAGAFDAQAAQAKANYADVQMTSIEVDDVSATTAHVTYTYSNSVLNQTKSAWLNESGAWHWNAC